MATTGLDDPQHYFALAAGNQWQYDYTKSDPNVLTPNAVVTQSVTGTNTVPGAPATALNRARSDDGFRTLRLVLRDLALPNRQYFAAVAIARESIGFK